jgi:hypothetical protein
LEQHPQCYVKIRNGRRLILVAYVDDLLAAGRGAREELTLLSKTVEMTPPEPVSRLLGTHYCFDLDKAKGIWTVRTNMREFFASVVERYEADPRTPKVCSNVKTPHVPWKPEDYTNAELQLPGLMADRSASILMGLLYGARMARPDLQYSIIFLSRFCSKWTRQADKMLHQLVGYVKSTLSHELVSTVALSEQLSLTAFSDADLGGCPLSSRSTSGGVLFATSSSGHTCFPVDWWAKRQCATSNSTAEAETAALAKAIRDHVIPTEILLEELYNKQIFASVYDDSKACIQVAKRGYSQALRHCAKTHRINIAQLGEFFSDGIRPLTYVDTRLQVADVFTKGLAAPQMLAASQQLGVVPRGSIRQKLIFELDISGNSNGNNEAIIGTPV